MTLRACPVHNMIIGCVMTGWQDATQYWNKSDSIPTSNGNEVSVELLRRQNETI